MKIAFDYQIFGWQKYGGISRYIYELANELVRTHAQDVQIIAPFFVNEYLKNRTGPAKIVGLPVPRIKHTGQILQIINRLLSAPLIAKFQPDLVHETYYSQYRIAPRNAKRIVTVHDLIHERYPDSFSASDPTPLAKRIAVEGADHLICNSKQTQQDLVNFLQIDPAKTSVVYLGFMHANRNTLFYENTLEKPYLLYVGDRAGYKNFTGLLRAISSSRLLQSEFRLICFGGGSFTNSERDLMRALGFNSSDVVQVSGTDNLLANYYKNAAAFIYPSLYEGFGIPPLEAMSASCPVTCSNTSSIPEVVGDAGLYFNPLDTDDMKNAIEQLVSDTSLRQQLIEAGKTRIKQFSWARCATETLDVYKKAVHGKKTTC